jgi:hypothetical protein
LIHATASAGKSAHLRTEHFATPCWTGSAFSAHVNPRRGNVCRHHLPRSNRPCHQRNAPRIPRSPLYGSSPRTRYTLTNQRHGFRSGYTRNWIVGSFWRATCGTSLAQVSTPSICTATVHMGVHKSFQPYSESVLGESSIRHNGPAAKRHQAWLRPLTRAQVERTMPGNVVLHAHRLELRRVLAASHWCRRNSAPGLALKEYPSITQLAGKLSQGRPLVRRPRPRSCSMLAQGRARKVRLVLRNGCRRVSTSRPCSAYLGPPALPALDSFFDVVTCRCVSQPSV